MVWLAVDGEGEEWVYAKKPVREKAHGKIDVWGCNSGTAMELPKGSIKKLTGINMTWKDEPVEILENGATLRTQCVDIPQGN